jgi:VRR-NUC domain
VTHKLVTQTENNVQQQVARLLESYCRPEVAWFAVPNGEWRFPRSARRLKLQGVRAGAPDLVLCVRGRFHGIELKRERGRTSDAQEEMRDEIERAGGSYHLCRGLIEAIQCLKDLGVFIPGIRLLLPPEMPNARSKQAPLPVLPPTPVLNAGGGAVDPTQSGDIRRGQGIRRRGRD